MTAGAVEETELKLELTREGADLLEASGLFPGEGEVVRQHARYFDTPDHALRQAGLSLRIRRNGEARVQTVKADGAAAGMFVRPEWERAVPGDDPVIDHTTPIPALVGDKAASAAPVFTVENERTIWDHEGIEIALDRGCILAGERQMPLCEVELEGKGGDVAALFRLARRIDAVVPVHLGVTSKAERGYLLLGPASSAVKAGSVSLVSSMTAATAFQAIINACIRHFRRNEPLVLANRNASALHQARVAVRRMRSALTIHKPMLTGGTSGKLNAELRWLASELGKARDIDVLLERAGSGPLSDRLSAARAEAYAGVEAALGSARARALMLDLAEWIVAGDWLSAPKTRAVRDLPAREFASEALDRFRKRVKKRGRDLERQDDHARHEVRKAAKKLRYATEFFAGLFDRKRERRRYKRFASALEDLQERLGALNDLASAPAVLEGLGLTALPGAARLLAHDSKPDLLDAAAEAHEAFVDARRFWR